MEWSAEERRVKMDAIIYHMDPDGYASAMVVYKYLRKQNGGVDPSVQWHPINYGMPIPKNLPYGEDAGRIYLVDFSFQPDDEMLKFADKLGDRLVWIDHHKTSVDLSLAFNVANAVDGVRWVNDVDGKPLSACELTWMFLNDLQHMDKDIEDRKEIPEVLSLIGDWDTWRHADMSDDDASKARSLSYYLGSISCDPSRYMARVFWDDLFSDKRRDFLRSCLYKGRELMEYQEAQWATLMESKAFEANFAGYDAIMLNQTGNSEMFNGFYDESKHDLMVTFQLVRGEFLTVSFYGTHTEDIHLGDLAKKLGNEGDMPSGGGHAGAAGFQCSWEYFKTLWSKG